MSGSSWNDLGAAAAAVLADPAPVVFVDTCALLDVLRAPLRPKAHVVAVTGAQRLIARANQHPRNVWLVGADLVMTEYHRHAAAITAELERELVRATRTLKAARETARQALPAVAVPAVDLHALGLHTELDKLAAELLSMTHVLDADDDRCHHRAYKRTVRAEAPASAGKPESADCAIVEHYLELASRLRHAGLKDAVCFVSSNTSDYGTPQKTRPPLDGQFAAHQITFVTDLAWADVVSR